jgi:hypothetical protein
MRGRAQDHRMQGQGPNVRFADASGVHVTAASARRVPVEACAVSLIAETIGTLSVELHDCADRGVHL